MPSADQPPIRIELDGGRVLLEHDVGIRSSDGLRLSCDVYRPNLDGRFPALLEHIPYRKDDLDAGSDRANAITFAREGFATVRLDVRGTGNSDGVAIDEYTADEQRDGFETVAWIAEQPWCTGNVGSWGVSYGGFACIQLAALRPPALKAIAPVYATDDRYTDDMHFSGGALCALELAHYPLRILAMNALPPLRRDDETAEAFGERWLERVEATPAWIERWLQEQVDGPYWRNGSLRPEPERIACPALIVAGWRDGYRTAMLRLASTISTEWQLLAGPWMHARPDHGIPGPAYPFIGELIRWFRRHLEDGAPSDDARPRTVFFLTEFDPPSNPPAEVSGSWLSSNSWPDQRGSVTTWFPSVDGTLSTSQPTATGGVTAPFGPAVGVMSGNWCPPPPGHGLPADQRPDDARSATFTSEPLPAPVEVFGQPRVQLRVRHPGPSAIVSVKLSDVSPDGESQLVTSGVLNLSHRNGHERPEPFTGTGDVTIELQATGWRFRAGHLIRLAVANSDWPTVWPLPTTDPIELMVEGCRMELPGLPPDAEPHTVTGDLASDPGDTGWSYEGDGSTWRIVTDAIAGTTGIEASDTWKGRATDGDGFLSESRRYQAFIGDADPLSADVEGAATFRVEHDGLAVRSTARGRFTSTADEFRYDVRLHVEEGGRRVRRQRWRGSVPRTLC